MNCFKLKEKLKTSGYIQQDYKSEILDYIELLEKELN